MQNLQETDFIRPKSLIRRLHSRNIGTTSSGVDPEKMRWKERKANITKIFNQYEDIMHRITKIQNLPIPDFSEEDDTPEEIMENEALVADILRERGILLENLDLDKKVHYERLAELGVSSLWYQKPYSSHHQDKVKFVTFGNHMMKDGLKGDFNLAVPPGDPESHWRSKVGHYIISYHKWPHENYDEEGIEYKEEEE